MNSTAIDINDLANPVLTDNQQLTINFLNKVDVDFSIDSILNEAKDACGLNDFGADDYLERLSILVNEWGNDQLVTQIGLFSLRNKLVQDARNRLLIQDQWNQHPDIFDIEIEKPIIIAGLPRSGTTHLLNLLAADSRLRSLAYWESCEPVVPFNERELKFANYRQDPRYLRCAEGWEAMKNLVPFLAIMHPMSPDHIHEEIEIMNPDFSSSSYEWMSPSPKWRDHYLNTDQTPHYQYMKNVLKLLIWQQRQKGVGAPERWVLKCIQHVEQLPVLSKMFPDSTVIFTHRDPISIIQSIITMLGYSQRINRKKPQLDDLLDYWSQRITTLLKNGVKYRETIPENRSIDVYFHAFMQNNIDIIKQIYTKIDLEITTQTQTEFAHYIEKHQRGKDGSIRYNLQRDFGIEPQQLRQRFQFYFDRYPIAVE